MEYTKGEWRITRGILNSKEIFITSNSGVDVAKVFYQLPNAKANAHLIAAAPDLYEALTRAQVNINWMLNNQQFLNLKVFDYIDKAIAKVEGGN